ncbi:hypothetical protein SCOCK_70148 [Actinacidiphila cocklensis]|uniref:Uncharacterized protein n=1 Tax=Actinacidiphila cocklensis TaxID=887465 RepID=A0A9W4EBF3_9ACTN|nr:hypothetical protein SCOCK_70148 [Actinacidiphila cocklensis]
MKSSGERLSDRVAVGVPTNVLAARLGRLAEAGLVMRIPYGVIVRPWVRDRLTDGRHDALPVLHTLAHGCQAHRGTGSRSPMA